MSCLRHVSKRLKGGTASDSGVRDTVEQMVHPSSIGLSEKVWMLNDFSIMHELQKPFVVVSPGMYESSHR